MTQNFCICICTYKRVESLTKLLIDLTEQTLLTEKIIIIDGDPSSKLVITLLAQQRSTNISRFRYVYVPTNHSNIAYHRYLGWKTAYDLGFDYIVYIDDDIRIYQKDAIAILMLPLINNKNNIVGVTGNLIIGSSSITKEDVYSSSNFSNKLISKFNRILNKQYLPGSLTPSGVRIKPNIYSQEGYGEVEWASGGVMAFALIKPGDGLFSADSFALHHKGYGLADDTIISQSLSRYGSLLLAKNAEFHHPSIDSTVTPSQPFKRGFALAISRRLIFESRKGYDDSISLAYINLLLSYIGNIFIQSLDLLKGAKKTKLAYNSGYFFGFLKGSFQKPTAKRLTPEIDWWGDAEVAVSGMVEF